MMTFYKKSRSRHRYGSEKPLKDTTDRILQRLRIKGAEDDKEIAPPKPFDQKVRKITKLLNICIALALSMLIGVFITPVEDTYNAEGIVRPGQYRQLFAPTDVEQWKRPLVTEGQQVKKGQILMEFRLPDLHKEILVTEQSLENAKSELEVKRAQKAAVEKLPLPKELWEIEQQFTKSKYNMEYYEIQLERMKKLAKSGDISEQDLDRARLDYEQAKIEYERFKTRYELIDRGYTDTILAQSTAEEEKILNEIQILKDRIEYLKSEHERLSVLRAPGDGIILDIPRKNVIGTIKAGEQLVYMSIGDSKVVQIFGLQKNFDKVEVQQRVRYKSRVYDSLKYRQAEGRVVKIGQIREPERYSQGSTSDRYYSIIATIDKQPKELKLDSNVSAQIIVSRKRLIKILFDID